MKIIHAISNFSATEKTHITIGTFDGVHFGHQEIIKKLVASAKKARAQSVLLTFFPHPKRVIEKNSKIELINTIDERALLLEKTGLDYLIIQPFDAVFSELSSLEFVKNLLIDKLHVTKLVIGYDHRFGKNREGNIEKLKTYSQLYNFEVEEISAQDINDVSVSSTKIRQALHNGNLKTANNYLGYHFMLNGMVVNGKHLGGTIGFPTANIDVKEAYKLIPKTGVYVVKSTIDGVTIFGMMNIGNRPTVNGTHQTIEVHFFNYNKDLYGKILTIQLIYFLRDEHKFDSLDALIYQLKKDREVSLKYIAENL